jgi:hypothetical protein
MYDPMTIAGLSVMRGVPLGDALEQGVLINRQMQEAQKIQQEQQQAQFMAQRLPQVLRDLEGKSPYEAAAMLQEAGLDPREISILLERLGIGGDPKQDRLVTGAGGVKYEQFKDENGQITMRPVPGQEFPEEIEARKAAQKQLAEEQKQTRKNIEILNPKQKEADKVTKALAEGEEADAEWDAATNDWNGSGTFAAKMTNLAGVKPDSWSQTFRTGLGHLFYNDKALAARDKITKLNSSLAQQILQGKDTRSAQTDAGKKLVSEGLPQDAIASSARSDVIHQYNEQSAEDHTRATFIKKWAAAHNDNDKGAIEEYDHFKKLYGLIDTVSGKVNPEALKKMDEYIEKDAKKDKTIRTPQEIAEMKAALQLRKQRGEQ